MECENTKLKMHPIFKYFLFGTFQSPFCILSSYCSLLQGSRILMLFFLSPGLQYPAQDSSKI